MELVEEIGKELLRKLLEEIKQALK